MSSLDVPSLLINLFILFEPYSPDKIKLVETLKCMQARICMHLVGNVCLEKRIVGITKVNGLRTIEKHKNLVNAISNEYKRIIIPIRFEAFHKTDPGPQQ